jgi:hypothetical protein
VQWRRRRYLRPSHPKGIGARAAETDEHIVIVVADQRIGELRAGQVGYARQLIAFGVAAGTGADAVQCDLDQPEIEFDRRNSAEIDRHASVGRLVGRGVVARKADGSEVEDDVENAADDVVGSGSAFDDIVAAITDEQVVTAEAVDLVVPKAGENPQQAGQRVVAGRSVECCHDNLP